MATNVAPTAIVVEVLRDDNYENWSACMESYMLAQDLWDFIEPPHHQEGEEVDPKTWRKKNAEALHAIQISCAPHTLSKIRHITSAKNAWDNLANLQKQHSPSHKEQSAEEESGENKNLANFQKQRSPSHREQSVEEDSGSSPSHREQSVEEDSGSSPSHREQSVEEDSGEIKTLAGAVSNEITGPLLQLYKHVHSGDWDATKEYLKKYPDAKKSKIKPEGGTALHVAAFAGNLKIVEELVKLMSEEELEIQDDEDRTALFFAARSGITKMAECLVRKNKKLLTFENRHKQLPLYEACIFNHKLTARYLYSVTPIEFFRKDNGHHGSYFLQCAIRSQMLDIAFDFLHRFPNFAAIKNEVLETTALISLSKMPEVFRSGNRLAFWQQLIFSCIRIQPIAATDDVYIDIPGQSQSESRNIILQVLSQLRGFAINLLTFFGIQQIYDSKKKYLYVEKILHCMCEHIATLDFEEQEKAGVAMAFHNAVRNGILEFVIEVVKHYPRVLMSSDKDGRNLFMSSIACRQEKVFSLFYGLQANREGFISLVDKSRNTMLHLAAKLSPSSQLARISGAALQMQRELQWYKEVESIINPATKDIRNAKNQIARELFTNEHKDLLVKGEKWMKQAATSSTVVGALIITIMFAAAFTVPGGNNQETGYPTFKDKKSFLVFLVSDAISLFFSSTSVLMFLGILTSRYAEEDFLISLPRKLVIGLSTLFFSIATMVVAFCAALIIVLHGRLQIIIPIVLLASVPVTVFMLLQFPLLVEIYLSTYRSGIFNKKMKRWY